MITLSIDDDINIIQAAIPFSEAASNACENDFLKR